MKLPYRNSIIVQHTTIVLYYNTNLSDTCTALPSINNLATTVAFPVNYGTLVSVGCNTGNTLSGDSSITCEKDTTFRYKDEPVCNQGK